MNARSDRKFRSVSYKPATDSGTVDLAILARLNPERYPYFLESSAAGPELASFDILFAFPGERLILEPGGKLEGPCAQGTDFLNSLDAWWLSERLEAPAAQRAGLPFTGGWFIYLGYELAAQVEPSIALTPHATLPTAMATRIPVAVLRDRRTETITIVAELTMVDEIARVVADLDEICSADVPVGVSPDIAMIEDDPEVFLSAVERAQQYIHAGDVFQANLSRCWRGNLPPDFSVSDLYLRLRETNPAPFSGLVQEDTFALISSSPERLVRRLDHLVDTRPIAGTTPRLKRPGAAEKQKQALLDHPKERAEHVMLIDLERNDLGRVCVGGSVKVDEFMVIESYAHVHHIVSNVSGRAREGLTPGELVRAVFPGGTITGCPKVRCMEIIHELEQRSRGAYTGSMGYLNLNGDCDLNILIRTMTVSDGTLEVAAGSGIVVDSDPQKELAETRAKAKGLLLALGCDEAVATQRDMQ